MSSSTPLPPRTARSMPFAYDVVPELELGYVCLYGHVTGAELTAVYTALFEDERWRSHWNVCWDGAGITTLVLVPEDVPAFMAAVREHAAFVGPGRSGILIGRPQDALTAHQLTAFARHHPDRHPGREIEQFETTSDLAGWLGLTVARLDALRARVRGGAEGSGLHD